MNEEPRIGVYICHCGVNIAGSVNIKEVVEYAKNLPNVIEARDYIFMCSAPGQEIIKEGVKKCNLNRVVVAACSPTMHEHTFRNVLAEAGINPYLLEMVNIREQCSWVHSDNKEAATTKAKILIKMAVAKASLLEPLKEITFRVNKNVLVIGGGVAGLSAARDLAAKGFKVYLIERKPVIGGNTARLGRLAHVEIKGIDLVRELSRQVLSSPNIHIYVDTELANVDGSVGDFKIKLVKNPRYVNEKCNLCGECVKVCPVDVPNEYEFGVSSRKAIYLPFREAYPPIYVVDSENCTRCFECVKVCPMNAINLAEKTEEIELTVGAIIIAAGHEPYEPPIGEFGYGVSSRVITLFQLERMLDEAGPTKGELKLDGREPKNIVFITCVGSLNTTPNAYPYCSRMCCSSTIKNALMIREKHPEANIYILHRDIRTYSRGDEQLYLKAGESLIRFARYREAPNVIVNPDGSINVRFFEETIQEEVFLPADLVVLSVGMKPPKDIDKVRTIVKVGCGPEGFLREAHLKLRPVEAATDGVYLAGTVTGPKNVIESIESGSAAASKASTLLTKEEVRVEPLIAVVDEERCSGCSICIGVCPYGAIRLKTQEEVRVAEVDPALCKGCGACAASCPTGAMQQFGFKDAQLKSQVLAALTK
ncbi:MAG: CoB--CoM heterodisulfide reductase iron-sulfur subunit A family protein [Thaumarchaeota archaeon]|jgi:heterodisulfide reductase subunit A|nr:CoB--CoM heterodisulfide reductase iron-sulfur subunit A family protein [Candidatus Geocrenenecus arthurdayi]MCL7389381.1 CoB--CoM heterodisulfide reductase iron-sulfur subunit A family protein [Candidatus Geocrenenecus arthurdayi]